jgi:hypothetical protein
MISRQNVFGQGAALSVALVCLTFNVPALAQTEFPTEGEDPAEVPAGEAPAAPPANEPEQPAGEPDAPPANEPEQPADEPDAPPADEPEQPADETENQANAGTEAGSQATEPDSNPENQGTATPVTIEVLPGSAFPSVQTRGIKYGSLWRTFHGQQWPYMPMVGGEPGIRIGFSGGIWNDLSNLYSNADPSLASENVNDQNRWTTQTRGVLRLTPTYNAGDDWFVQGNVELVAAGDMRPDPVTQVLATTDDVFVRFGKWNVFDVTVGRFQAWEIANHYGMGLDQNTLERTGARINNLKVPPTDGYGLSYFWDRQNFLLGTYAVHIYPTKYLRGELLGHIGSGNSTSTPYQVDVRPAAIFDVGWVKLKAGWEYGNAIPQDSKQRVRDSKNGFGFAAQFVLDPYVEFGGSFARGFQDVLDQYSQADLNGSNTVQTVGGFLNGSPGYEPLVLGVGGFWNSFENFRTDTNPASERLGEVDTNKQRLLFAAVQYTIWERVFLKFIASHASNTVSHFDAGVYTNESMGARLRAEFLF